jgi:hypothetical protein
MGLLLRGASARPEQGTRQRSARGAQRHRRHAVTPGCPQLV